MLISNGSIVFMYTFQQKAEVTQISLTGSRLIVILGALMLEPRSIDELNTLVTDCGLVDKNYSKDTIRIALSTLKAAGCEISRPCKTSDFKYKLLSHPFVLNISELEIQTLKTLYNNLTNGSDLKKAIKFNSFLNKIAHQVYNQDIEAALKNITAFKKIDTEITDTLIEQEGKHNTLIIKYLSPTSNKPSTKTIIFGSLFLKSNTLYLEGVDVNSNKNTVLKVSRIAKIEGVENNETPFVSEHTKVIYSLSNPEHHSIDENQKILKTSKNTALIEAEFKNEFFAMQHVLSLGSDCMVVEPEDFKNKVINKLKELRKIYE